MARELKEMLLFQEAKKMTNQEAWDSLVHYSISWYGIYGVDRPEIQGIKSCMLVLDKCSSVKKETINQLEHGYWDRIYTVKTTQGNSMIRISFRKKDGMVEVNFAPSKGQVILK